MSLGGAPPPSQAFLDECRATGKKFVCLGCGMAYATNSQRDFLDHCLEHHDDLVEDFILDEMAFIDIDIPAQEKDEEPFDTLGLSDGAEMLKRLLQQEREWDVEVEGGV